jgi:adenylosuccinate synthase
MGGTPHPEPAFGGGVQSHRNPPARPHLEPDGAVRVGGWWHQVHVCEHLVVDLGQDRRQSSQSFSLTLIEVGEDDRLAPHIETGQGRSSSHLIGVRTRRQHDLIDYDCPVLSSQDLDPVSELEPDHLVENDPGAVGGGGIELSSQHPAGIDEPGRAWFEEGGVTGHQIDPSVEIALGVGDCQFGGDCPHLGNPDGVTFGQHHPRGEMEADTRALLQVAVSGYRRLGQNRPFPAGIEMAGDPPRVVMAAKRPGVNGEHRWFWHSDPHHLEAPTGQMAQRRRPDQTQSDDPDCPSHARKIVTGFGRHETGDRDGPSTIAAVPATIVLGAQWGDEGKGRVTDSFAESADFVVRYQGGNNAGHTIIIGDQRYALSLIPSGVMYPSCTPVIASGCVIDPKVLLGEIDMLTGRGIDPSQLKISANAHLIMPYHRKLDAVMERHLGRNQIGTTKKGIGPAYTDKFSRRGIRVQDLYDPKIFRDKVEAVLADTNRQLTRVYNQLPMDGGQIADEYLTYAERLLPHVTDTSLLLWEAIRAGRSVLFEGAQGSLLDVDHGTYPFVTSSNPTAGGASVGSGIGPKDIDRIVGVAKAYISRVGTGPFPTELKDEIGDRMIELGGEYGVVTGRRRRCGWLDLVVLRYAARINSLTDLFITKLDILSAFDTIKVATAYTSLGERYTEFPRQQRVLYNCTPVYEEFPGWHVDISSCRNYSDLPAEARNYLEFIEETVGVPVRWVSVGPERHQLIHRP